MVILLFATPKIFGMHGPSKSESMIPTRNFPANEMAKLAEIVDLPTPPLPPITATLFFILLIRSLITGIRPTLLMVFFTSEVQALNHWYLGDEVPTRVKEAGILREEGLPSIQFVGVEPEMNGPIVEQVA